jgi:hypothetical protein
MLLKYIFGDFFSVLKKFPKNGKQIAKVSEP